MKNYTRRNYTGFQLYMADIKLAWEKNKNWKWTITFLIS